jgi:hypothetical protein
MRSGGGPPWTSLQVARLVCRMGGCAAPRSNFRSDDRLGSWLLRHVGAVRCGPSSPNDFDLAR